MIRKANLDDAENIAQILVHSWQVNFRNIVPEDYLNQMSVHKITKGIRKSLEVNTLFVYEKLGGKFIGSRTVEYGGKQSIERLYGWNLN